MKNQKNRKNEKEKIEKIEKLKKLSILILSPTPTLTLLVVRTIIYFLALRGICMCYWYDYSLNPQYTQPTNPNPFGGPKYNLLLGTPRY